MSSGRALLLLMSLDLQFPKQIAVSTACSCIRYAMRSVAGIEPDDFNIEGAAAHGADWQFLNRGNEPGRGNVLFAVHEAGLTENFQLSFDEIGLPVIDGLSFGFSDATVAGDTLYPSLRRKRANILMRMAKSAKVCSGP